MIERVAVDQRRANLTDDAPADSEALNWSDLTEHLAQCKACSAFWLDLLGGRKLLVRPATQGPDVDRPDRTTKRDNTSVVGENRTGASTTSSVRNLLVMCAVLAGLIMVSWQFVGRGAWSGTTQHAPREPTNAVSAEEEAAGTRTGATTATELCIAIEVGDQQDFRACLAKLEADGRARIVDTAAASTADHRQAARYVIEIASDDADEVAGQLKAMGRPLWERGAAPGSQSERLLIEVVAIE